MAALLHELLARTAKQATERLALQHGETQLRYGDLQLQVLHLASGLRAQGLRAGDRIAIYLPKQIEAVVAMIAASAAGAVFVPINPALKPAQVQHILRDCGVRFLLSSGARVAQLGEVLIDCTALTTIVVSDALPSNVQIEKNTVLWSSLMRHDIDDALPLRIDHDIAAILYTSGSTGKPKGVVLSHRNLVAGAESVSSYLHNTHDDRLLALLPLSFDYGLSQITTAFRVGASVALLDYLVPQDVIKACARYQITGLAAVPPLWSQLAQLQWPENAKQRLRYWTNSGGHMPRTVLQKLRAQLPQATPYLMYGLTEAFRSTYLPPEQLDARPDSIGKAIPNADIRVLRHDGSECNAEEPGELVHRGALVALGYWNDAVKTAERFKPLPAPDGVVIPEIAVFSGDTVKKDRDGYLYFIGRDDELIKSNAYRISPTEIEDALLTHSAVNEAVVFGVPHAQYGQAIIALVTTSARCDEADLRQQLNTQLPGFMQPHRVIAVTELPRNANGKFDRAALRAHYHALFDDTPA